MGGRSREASLPWLGLRAGSKRRRFWGIKGILRAHQREVLGRDLTKRAIRLCHQDLRASDWEPNGFVQDIRPQQLPRELPGCAPRRVVEGYRRLRKRVTPALGLLPPHAPQRRGIKEHVFFLGKLGSSPIAEDEVH